MEQAASHSAPSPKAASHVLALIHMLLMLYCQPHLAQHLLAQPVCHRTIAAAQPPVRPQQPHSIRALQQLACMGLGLEQLGQRRQQWRRPQARRSKRPGEQGELVAVAAVLQTQARVCQQQRACNRQSKWTG